jgi:two-component system OmpR family response regulator
MMPRKDGFTLAKDIRERDMEVPIIFLTAKTMKDDVLQGFKIGADDYIAKPFNSEELLLRIQAVLKRVNKVADPRDDQREYIIGKYHFNFPLRILTFNDAGTRRRKPVETQSRKRPNCCACSVNTSTM